MADSFSEWYLVESRDGKGEWWPVRGSGSFDRAGAERTIDSLCAMRPAAARSSYRVARYVRDEASL